MTPKGHVMIHWNADNGVDASTWQNATEIRITPEANCATFYSQGGAYTYVNLRTVQIIKVQEIK